MKGTWNKIQNWAWKAWDWANTLPSLLIAFVLGEIFVLILVKFRRITGGGEEKARKIRHGWRKGVSCVPPKVLPQENCQRGIYNPLLRQEGLQDEVNRLRQEVDNWVRLVADLTREK